MLESGIPELVDIQELVRDYWEEVQRPWIASNFTSVMGQLVAIQSGRPPHPEYSLRSIYQTQGALGSLVSQWGVSLTQYMQYMVYSPLKGAIDGAVDTLISRLDSTGDLASMQVALNRIESQLGPLQQIQGVVVNVGRETVYNRYDTSLTLRGMVDAIYWETVAGGKKDRRGPISNLFRDVAGIPGAVAEGLADSFEGVTDATKKAIGDAVETMGAMFDGAQNVISEAMKSIFGDPWTSFLANPFGGFGKGIISSMADLQEATPGIFASAFASGSWPRQSSLATLSAFQAKQTHERVWQILKRYERAPLGESAAALSELRDNLMTQAIMVSGAIAAVDVATPFATAAIAALGNLWVNAIGYPAVNSMYLSLVARAALLTTAEYELNAKWLPRLPSLRDALSAYGRSKISTPQFDQWLRFNGIDPSRELIEPMTWMGRPIRTVSQMYDQIRARPAGYFMLAMVARSGIYDEEKYRQLLADSGYGPEVIDFCLQGFEATTMTSHRRAYEATARQMFRDGQLSLGELESLFHDLGYSPEQVAFLRRIWTWQRDMRRRVGRLRAVTRQYVARKISESEFRSRLSELGFVEDEIEYLVDVTEQKELPERRLSLSQASWAVRHGIITEPQFERILIEMGYPEEDRRVLRERALFEPEQDESERIEKQVVRLRIRLHIENYRDGRESKQQLITNLMMLGLPEELAIAYADYEEARLAPPVEEAVAVEDAAEARRVRRLRGMAARYDYRNHVIEEDELYSRLLEAGYSDVEAGAIVTYERARRKPLPPPPEAVVS